MKPTGATKEAAGHSPLPWHVFEGGNFIKIATEGYEQYVKEHQYLGGPFSVASMEHSPTENYQSDHEKALANAQLIVTAVNERERLREALRLAAINIDYLTNWIQNTYGGDNDDVKLGRAYAKRARAILNDATPSTSAGGGRSD